MGHDSKRKAKAKQARKAKSDAEMAASSIELDPEAESAQETIGGHPKPKVRQTTISGAIKKKKVRVSLSRMKAGRRHLAR